MARLHRAIIALVLVVVVLALSVELTVSAATDDDTDLANALSAISTPDARLDRKQRKLALHSKRQSKFDDLTKSKARVTHAKLKSDRVGREKKLKSQSEKLRKTTEEDVRLQQELKNSTLIHEANQKIREMVALTSGASNHIIGMDNSQYKSLVIDGNRPYYVFLTFTALSPQAQCGMCHEFSRAVIPVANQYYEDVIGKLSDSGEYHSQQPLIFFVNIDIAKNREIFDAMKLQNAPITVMLAPRLATKALKVGTVLNAVPAKNKFQFQNPRLHPHDIVTYVHKVTNTMINVNYNAVNGEEIIIGVLTLATVAFVVYRYFDSILALRTSPSLRLLLCVVGWCLYMWCISGGMYNIIKGNIFAHTEKDKPTEYISNEPRDQYGAEGLILGALNILAASSLLLVNTRAFQSNTKQSLGTFASLNKSVVGQIWASVSPVLRPELCIGLMAAFWFYIVSIYSWKNRGYRMGLVWY